MRPTSSFIAQATTAVTRNQTRRSLARRTHPPTRSTGTSASGWKSCSAGRSTTGDAHQRIAGTAATQPAAPCARASSHRSGAVAASARVCTTSSPGRAGADRPERGEERDSRFDVIAEQRPEVDRVERLVQVAEQPDVLREDPVVEVGGEGLVAQQRERADDEGVETGDAQHDPPHEDVRLAARRRNGRVDGARAGLVHGRRGHTGLKSAWPRRRATRRAWASRRPAVERRERPSP